MERVDAIVIGAGVVGLAVARALAQRGLETLVLESERAIGTGTSSRNSEVIHAGLYYPIGSLKAQLCVRGRHLLYEYCASHGVPHRRCGKLVVATATAQEAALEDLYAQARANGVDDVQLITAAQARAMEPQLHCIAALHSAATGIVDSHRLMLALQGDFEAAGGLVALASPVQSATVTPQGITLEVGGEQPMKIQAACVVNAAGLQAQALAQRVQGLLASSIPAQYYAKGSYFSLAGRAPFGRLIYPVPEPGGLGVHLTLDLGGQARFGPDVEWVQDLDYTVNPRRADGFYAAIRRYWPALQDGALQPAYAGIRPKITGPGEPSADFLIQGPAAHGAPGWINLYGIESPGLTSALAIGEVVSQML
jgi:L-2-hydroxyglutarate oxidase LhgO